MILTRLVVAFGNILSYFVNKLPQEKLKNITANKILIIKSGAIGDVLMTTPFLRALRKRFPNSEIDYIVGKESAKVLEDNRNISNLISVKSEHFHSLNLLNKIALLNKIRTKKYDVCFILDKSWLANCFIFLTRIPIRIGFDRFGEGFTNKYNVQYAELKHEIKYYLELAYFVGAKEEKNKNMELNLTNEDKKFAEEFQRKNKAKRVIGIASGGGKNPGIGIDATRIWPEEKFVELINKLEGHSIILFGGAQDKELCDRILNKMNENIKKDTINLAGQTSIKETAALMQKCECVITNDAGPMHIASAVNKKVISIFGPTHPLRKAPLHIESKWIWKDEDKYDFRCDIYSTKYAEGKEFMENISAETVYEEVKKVLG